MRGRAIFLPLIALAAPLLAAQPLSAQDDLMPMDLAGVDPALVEDMFGAWVITDLSGEKTCNVTLSREETIGGMVIEVDPACPSVFPVMADVAAWRLMDNWTIDLADATRKRLIRFTTPDAGYIADPETDGIWTIVKP